MKCWIKRYLHVNINKKLFFPERPTIPTTTTPSTPAPPKVSIVTIIDSYIEMDDVSTLHTFFFFLCLRENFYYRGVNVYIYK